MIWLEPLRRLTPHRLPLCACKRSYGFVRHITILLRTAITETMMSFEGQLCFRSYFLNREQASIYELASLIWTLHRGLLKQKAHLNCPKSTCFPANISCECFQQSCLYRSLTYNQIPVFRALHRPYLRKVDNQTRVTSRISLQESLEAFEDCLAL